MPFDDWQRIGGGSSDMQRNNLASLRQLGS